MQKKNLKIGLCLIPLLCAGFVMCHNEIIDKWWDDKAACQCTGNTECTCTGSPGCNCPPQAGTDGESEGSGDNFGVVIFDTDGGTPQPKAIRLAWGSAVGRLRPISRGNDGFIGWFDENGESWDIETRPVTKEDDVDGDGFINLTIQWVSVDDPTPVYVVQFVPYPQSIVPVLPGNAVTIPDQYIADGGRVVQPVKPPVLDDGRGFAGWFTSVDYQSQWDFNLPPPSDVTLYAMWEHDTRTVLFEANGGTRPDKVTRLNHEFTISLRYGLVQDPGPLVRTGFSFGGWYVNPDFSGVPWNFAVKKVTDSDVPQMNPLILYAKWVQNVYIVNFVIHPSSPAVYKPEAQFVVHGSGITQPVNPPRLENGESFAGWYTDESYLNKWDFANGMVTSTMTLYAKYTPQIRTVIFKVNGGNDLPQTIFNIQVGSRITDPGDPVRTGHAFEGWFFDMAAADNKIDFSSYILEAPDEVIGMEPLYLYAGWMPIIYTVRFYIDGAEAANQSVQHGQRIQMPNLTNSGKALDGWHLNSLSGTLWDFDTIVTSDISLYSQWKNTRFIVRFHLGTGAGDSYGKIPQSYVPPEQHYPVDGRVIEPYMPANTDPDGWSFLRWDCAFPPQSSDLSNINNPGWRSNLHSYNRFGMTIDDMYTITEGGVEILNLYARWVPPVQDMVWIPKGSFTMGDASVAGNPAAYHAYPARRVTLDGFYISKYEVTEINSPYSNRGYQQIMGLNPSQHSNNSFRPVERVSWYDAIEYCIKLTEAASLGRVYTMDAVQRTQTPLPGTNARPIVSANVTVNSAIDATGYRLPTEAEWEYAARGGGFGSPVNFAYSGSNNPDAVAWYNVTVQAQPVNNQATQIAGSKQANTLGLYDMSGNVSEWVWDRFAPYNDAYYSTSAASRNPRGPASGDQRVIRGGGWNNAAGNVLNVARNSDTPDTVNSSIGFRVVRDVGVMW